MSLRINLWTGPRNISTTMMYAFAQRSDTQVVDEPLYGHYLRVSRADHPGAEEVMAVMDCNGTRVVQEVILGPCSKPVLFLKNMTHHLVDLEWDFMEQCTNIILTRDPKEMLPSLAKNLDTPILRDTGYKKQVQLLETLTHWSQTPPILEARQLLLDPKSVLQQLCERIGLDFQESMLHWPAGPRPEDGVWAKYWYHNVHRSTGFKPYKPKTEPFPDSLRPLLAECQPYYEQLAAHAIRP